MNYKKLFLLLLVSSILLNLNAVLKKSLLNFVTTDTVTRIENLSYVGYYTAIGLFIMGGAYMLKTKWWDQQSLFFKKKWRQNKNLINNDVDVEETINDYVKKKKEIREKLFYSSLNEEKKLIEDYDFEDINLSNKLIKIFKSKMECRIACLNKIINSLDIVGESLKDKIYIDLLKEANWHDCSYLSDNFKTILEEWEFNHIKNLFEKISSLEKTITSNLLHEDDDNYYELYYQCADYAHKKKDFLKFKQVYDLLEKFKASNQESKGTFYHRREQGFELISYCLKNDYDDVLEFLHQQCSIDFNKKNKYGYCPLQLAIYQNPLMIKCLIKNGAYVLKNSSIILPAAKQKNQLIYKKLIKRLFWEVKIGFGSNYINSTPSQLPDEVLENIIMCMEK